MKLVAQVKLLPTEEQRRALLETLRRTNAACNRLSSHAWEAKCFRQFDLHAALYQSVREETGLNSQVVVRAIAKVADAYKLDRDRPRTFRPEGSIAYDRRILRFFTEAQEVSIWTVEGRVKIAFAAGGMQKRMLLAQKGESDLAYIGGEFYLMAVCEVPEAPLMPVTDVLGVDLGIVQLASDSEGNQYTGEPIRCLRRRMRKLKAGLQHTAKTRQSKSAKRHLQRLRRRQSRFTRWVNHNISRRLVEAAATSGKAIVLEDLTGIRERASVMSREMRFELGSWAFYQLGQFVCYKAKRAGVPVVFVDPRNTSRTCSTCGHCDKHNRRSQSRFQCQECGLELNADLNAALNIRARGAVTRPIDGAVASASATVKAPSL